MANEIAVEIIASKILEVRGRKVMLDNDLAKLYGVQVKVLNQAVKRNIKRFPSDFMHQLTWQEITNLKSQIVTSSSRSQIVTLKQGQNIKYLPYVFTEQGVAMLSSVLNSERAVMVNIQIMRAFVKLKELLLTHKDLADKLEALERKYTDHDEKIKVIFEAIRQLLQPPPVDQNKRIGFHS